LSRQELTTMDSPSSELVSSSSQKRFVAPDMKRRQLIFDSFSKLRECKTNRRPASPSGSKGTLLYAWGAGYHGQLGLSSYRKKCKLVPAHIDFKEPILQVACGGFHTAVLTDSGRVYTWGDGRFGQLGNLARKHNMLATPHIVDRLASFDIQVSRIACGQYHTACVTHKGDMYSWGSGKYGQLGHATRLDERYPRHIDVDSSFGQFKNVSCGDRHTAAVTNDGRVVTFGSGQHGQLGHGSGWDFLKPKVVEALLDVEVIDTIAGSTVTCAITSTGQLYLWGFGESIHPKEHTNIVDTPRLVNTSQKVIQVAVGQSHIIVLNELGDLYTFGSGGMGQLGHGTRSNIRFPRLILKGKNVQAIAAGRYHSMAVTAQGALYSWGCGESGQLAHNSLESELFPRVVDAILPNVVGQIVCGEHHTFCLSSIEHASVSPDVQNWKVVEDISLAFKKSMIGNKRYPDAQNGLKTKHIAIVEQQEARIVEEVKKRKEKEKEEETKHVNEQLESIEEHSALLEQVRKAQEEREEQDLIYEKNAAANASTTGSGTANGGNNRQKMRRHTLTRSTPLLRAKKGNAAGSGSSPIAHDGDQSPKDQSPGRMDRNSKNTRSMAAVGGDGFEPLPYQPLLPRMSFMEKTTTALQKVKKYLQGGALKACNIGTKELFESKNQYNTLRAESKEKAAHLERLRNSFVFMRPTEEDKHYTTQNQLRIKELNMKLVTLNTRLMEADENKKNYELYIIRMKEEDVQLSKQIDHLRHLVVEYDRLLTKMDRMNHRVNNQKREIDEEIVKFSQDIDDFQAFTQEQLKKYRKTINKNVADSRITEKMALERESKLDDRRQKRLVKLQQDYDDATEEATEVKEELKKWLDKVQFYEHRFHKITAATGLTNSDDIINKFFFNDEITSDLNGEIKLRTKEIEELNQKKQEAETHVQQLKEGYVQSKWRDVDELESQFEEKNLRMTREKVEADRIYQKLALIKEGVQALLQDLDERFLPEKKVPEDEDSKSVSEADKDGEPKSELKMHEELMTTLSHRIIHLADSVKRAEKKRNKKTKTKQKEEKGPEGKIQEVIQQVAAAV